MFYGTPFNQPLNSWVVSNVNNMNNMFAATTLFNQDIGDWDVSSVDNMSAMFNGATAFNGDVSIGWNIFNVTNMEEMFKDATSFNQDIGGWDIRNVTNFIDFMAGATSFSTTNYDLLLNGWKGILLAYFPNPGDYTQTISTTFASKYSTSGSLSRVILIDGKPDGFGWTIADEGID
jgi:surface protein|tara:strand:- start:61 stop:588 length:528 start_codon:yes stop_codon:yes gene_type:complete